MDPDPKNLIVNYIPTPVTDEELRQLFEKYGEVESARVIIDRQTMHPKGYGFVKFKSEPSAKAACAAMNGFVIHNKRLKVTTARGPQSAQIDNYQQRAQWAAKQHHIQQHQPPSMEHQPPSVPASAPFYNQQLPPSFALPSTGNVQFVAYSSPQGAPQGYQIVPVQLLSPPGPAGLPVFSPFQPYSTQDPLMHSSFHLSPVGSQATSMDGGAMPPQQQQQPQPRIP